MNRPLTARERALARARTYGWVAEVLLDGWTPRARSVGSELPWLPQVPTDDDQAAARHEQVFGRGVPPYESVFRSPDGLLGGAVAASVRDAYVAMGFRHTRTDTEPDHAGLQCAALSFLCAAEADAHRDGVDAERIAGLQVAFIGDHLGRWVELWRTAVARQGVDECTALLDLLADLVAEHGAQRGEQPMPPTDTLEGEALLADPRVGLKAVARYLAIPARCGLWLGAEDVQRIAASTDLTCGFGPRVKMLEGLWFSAVDHERVPELALALGDAVRADGALDPRREATLSMLRELSRAAASARGSVRDHTTAPPLRLEPLVPDHADALFEGLCDPELYRFIPRPPPASLEALRTRYERLSSRSSPDGTEAWLNWAIWSEDDAATVGFVQATVGPSAEIAYVLCRPYWGRGHARTAVAAMLEIIDREYGPIGCQAHIDPRNVASVALVRALGFVHVGTEVDADIIDGEPADEATYRF